MGALTIRLMKCEFLLSRVVSRCAEQEPHVPMPHSLLQDVLHAEREQQNRISAQNRQGDSVEDQTSAAETRTVRVEDALGENDEFVQ